MSHNYKTYRFSEPEGSSRLNWTSAQFHRVSFPETSLDGKICESAKSACVNESPKGFQRWCGMYSESAELIFRAALKKLAFQESENR
jgi:hypothetical protein